MFGPFAPIGIILPYFLQVIRLAVSMLLQNLRCAEPTVEGVIASNLVDLALCAPQNVFVDIIRAFSAISRTANPDDPKLSNNMVCHRFEGFNFKGTHRIELGSCCTD